MNPTELIDIVTAAVSALDSLLDFWNTRGISTDVRARVFEERAGLEALLIRLQSLGVGTVALNSGEAAVLQQAGSKLRAASLSATGDVQSVFEVSSAIQSILGPDTASFSMLPGDDPTKPKG